jgi:hypothetical protein
MKRRVRLAAWVRALAISLLLVGLSASPSQAADPSQTPKVLARMAYGLISAGVQPADAMDVVVNLRFCSGAPDYDAATACMKPYLDKAGIRSIGDLDFYASVIGHFSVYDGLLKTTGGMDVKPGGFNQNIGTRTDAQGRTARFSFYFDTGDFVDFEYSTSSDHGQGYVYWVNNCTLVGTFYSAALTDSFGSPVQGLIVMRRCGSSAGSPSA